MINSCTYPKSNEFERQVSLLKKYKNIAVIGMSPNPQRPSREVGLFLKQNGYNVIPIHPTATEIEGLKVYKSLKDAIKEHPIIEIVDLFVSGDVLEEIIKEAYDIGAKVIWFQPGATNDKAIALARSLNFDVVVDSCTMATLKRAKSL